MPVEIRELIIRTTVVNNGGEPGDAGTASSGGDEAIIAACVEQVLQILERQRER